MDATLKELDYTPEEATFPEITRLDRCDNCSAAAVSAVQISMDLPLLYLCGHHLRKNRPALDEKGYSYLINDDIRRNALFELPAEKDANKPYVGI